jgi:hypothetical protein
MRPKIRVILEDVFDEGILHGIRRAYKHTSDPNHNALHAAIKNALMEALYDKFTFDEDELD